MSKLQDEIQNTEWVNVSLLLKLISPRLMKVDSLNIIAAPKDFEMCLQQNAGCEKIDAKLCLRQPWLIQVDIPKGLGLYPVENDRAMIMGAVWLFLYRWLHRFSFRPMFPSTGLERCIMLPEHFCINLPSANRCV